MAGARGRHPLRRSAAARLTRPVLPNGGCGGVGCPRRVPAQHERHGPHTGHVPFVARPSPAGAVRHALLEAFAVLIPVACAGCGGPDRSVCAPCIAALRPVPRLVARDGVAAWAALEYSGAVARVIGAYKDGARTDAAGPLADAMAAAIIAALDGLRAASVEVCTVPSTAAALRRRGYAPVDALLARRGIRPARALRLVRAH